MRVLALQHTAGNRAVVRMLASRTGVPAIQRSNEGTDDLDLEDPYADEDYAESEGEEEDYDDEELQEGADQELEEDEDQVIAALSGQLRSVVVWGGSRLADRQIQELKEFDIPGLMSANQNSTKAVAQALAEKHGDVSWEEVQQALDQELETHPATVRSIVDRLGKLQNKPTVYRPPDDLLLLPASAAISQDWLPTPRQPLAAAAAQPTLLISVSHGDDTGKTLMLGHSQPGLQIATHLNLSAANDQAFMYVPLQCYPQQAVKRWEQATRRPAASMPVNTKSSDGEMQDWVRDQLRKVVIKWLQDL